MLSQILDLIIKTAIVDKEWDCQMGLFICFDYKVTIQLGYLFDGKLAIRERPG